MVASKLNPLIEYKEPATPIAAVDEGNRCPVYEINLPITNKHYLVALGKPNLEFTASHGVVYYPMYLLKHNRVVRMVGVLEVEKGALIGLLDANNQLRAENIEPLLFDTITEEFLAKIGAEHRSGAGHSDSDSDSDSDAKKAMRRADSEAEAEEEFRDSDDDLFSVATNTRAERGAVDPNDPSDPERVTLANVFTKANPPPKRVPTVPQSITAQKEASARGRNTYVAKHLNAPNDVGNWVQKFMESSTYGIRTVAGKGDCLFLCLVDAYAELGYTTTVQKLRRILAQETNQRHFDELRSLYTGIANEIAKNKMDIEANKKMNRDLKARSKNTTKAEAARFAESAAALKSKHEELKDTLDQNLDMLEEFAFMQHLATLTDLRAYVQTRNFWADTWAISVLERVLEVKLVILRYSPDKDDVIQCGQLNDAVTSHDPKHYILLDYSGDNHYQLITADGRRIFTFEELPFDIKVLVVKKCMERSAGPYYVIPDFKQFQVDLNLTPQTAPVASDSASESKTATGSESSSPSESATGSESAAAFDASVMFRFHADSDAKKAPGDVNGEKLPKKRAAEFSELGKITGWRQQLDDTYIAPFSIEDKSGVSNRWASVVHYVYATILRPVSEEAWVAFSMDSGTSISKSAAMVLESVAKKGGKKGKYTDAFVSALADPEVDSRRLAARKQALFAKFKQPDLTTTLYATKQAQLLHFVRGKEPESDTLLMLVRSKIHQ